MSLEGLMPYLKNSAWLIGEKTLRLFTSIVIGAAIARHLGPEQYGVMALVFSYVAFIQAVISLGVDGFVIRDVSSNSSNRKNDRIFSSIYKLKYITGLFIFLIVCLLSFVFRNGPEGYLIFAAFFVLFYRYEIVDIYYQSKSKSKYTVKNKVISLAIASIIKITFLLLELDLIWFILSTGIELSIYYILLGIYNRTNLNLTDKVDFSYTKELLLSSWPLLLSSLSSILVMRVDLFFISNMLDLDSTGLYSSAMTISLGFTFVPMMLFTSFAPLVAKTKQANEKEYYKVLYGLFRLFAFVGITLSILLYFLSDFIILFLFGNEFYVSSEILKVHCFSNIFINLGIVQSLWIINEGRSKISLYRTLIGLTVSIILNYLLIPIYGIMGSAYSFVVSQFVQNVAINVYFSRKILFMQFASMFLVRWRFAVKYV